MRIQFKQEFKSLKSFTSDELNDFTVITGKNGSGKSQLIELLKLKGHEIIIGCDTKYIQFEGVHGNNLTPLNNDSWKLKVSSYIQQYKAIGTYARWLIDLFFENDIWNKGIKNNSYIESLKPSNENELKKLIINAYNERRAISPNTTRLPYVEHNVDNFDFIERQLIEYNYLFDIKRCVFVAKIVAESKSKNLWELNDADFYLSPIPENLLSESKLFNSTLDYIFYIYVKRRDLNARLYFDKIEFGSENGSIKDSEFIIKFPPPWIQINNIFKENKVGFEFRGIERQDFSPDNQASFPLIKLSSNKEIHFSDLSSGEKVIIGLIIKLFTSKTYGESLEFPDLLILDEPDAFLHPEMSKLLIEVLHSTFVNEFGIKVIITTHSPSTIALCPEESVFQLKNEPFTSLQKIEKEEALKMLTEFIPTLSIDYKNHKQVFVESPTDIRYYQTIFNKLYQEKKYNSKLYFISNSYGQGNCDQVKGIVEAIRESGNTTSFGIIDWDLRNKSTDYVKVHGEIGRYSIENFLYDPIYLCVLFMSSNGSTRVFQELGLDESYNQLSIGNEDEKFLQKVVEWFFEKYYQVVYIKEDLRNIKREVSYFNGKKIQLPVWFLESQGHDLEVKLKKVFPVLTSNKFLNEGELQKELTFIIAKCYPFIPSDSVDVIEELLM